MTTPLETLRAADRVDQQLTMAMAVQAADAIESIAQALNCPRRDALTLAYTLLSTLDDDAYRTYMRLAAKMLTDGADDEGLVRADHEARQARCGRSG